MAAKCYEIGKNFYLIRSEEKEFHRNIYLKRFVGPKRTFNMLMDPGTKLDLADLMVILKELIGGIQNVDMIFLSHQDPDVTSNCSAILTTAPRAIVIASIDTWRLIHMYGISEKRFLSIEKVGFRKLHLKKTDHTIQFVPARFCHFRGSMMIYDHESGILFTGDFMAGVNSRKGKGYKATDESWSGISMFHQIYMPSKEALHETVHRIGMLEPLPKMIAPQHGDVISGELMHKFLLDVASLDVGIELSKSLEPDQKLVVAAIDQFLGSLKGSYPEYHEAFLQRIQKGGQFTTPVKFTKDSVSGISVKSNEAFLYIWNTMLKVIPEEVKVEVKTLFVVSLDAMNLPLPDQIKEEDGDFVTDLF